MAHKIILIIITSLSLLACNEPNKNTPNPVKKIDAKSATVVVKKPTEKIIEKEEEKTEGGNEGKPNKEFDLTLPEPQTNPTKSDWESSEKKNLPNLFEKKEKDKIMSIDGKILHDETDPDYFNSIKGAELSIKVKTK